MYDDPLLLPLVLLKIAEELPLLLRSSHTLASSNLQLLYQLDIAIE